MFHEREDFDIENYADDTTRYACASDIDTAIPELQITACELFTWFNSKHMKANPKKSHFLLSSKSSPSEKLLGVKIDSDITFDKHISSIFNKVVMKAFIESQFNYFPLIWMFHSRTLNSKINRLHGRVLRIIYSDYKLPFCELLEKEIIFNSSYKYS